MRPRSATDQESMEGDWDNWGPGWDQQQRQQARASQEDEARGAAEEGEEAGSSGGTTAKRRFSLGLLGKKIASAANNLGEAVARWVLARACLLGRWWLLFTPASSAVLLPLACSPCPHLALQMHPLPCQGLRPRRAR
jgi:hypothetical protein